MPDMLLYVVGNYEKAEVLEQEAHWMVTNGRKMYFILRFPTSDCILEYFVNSDVQRARKYYGGSCYGLSIV